MGSPCSQVSMVASSAARSSISDAALARMWAHASASVAAHSGTADERRCFQGVSFRHQVEWPRSAVSVAVFVGGGPRPSLGGRRQALLLAEDDGARPHDRTVLDDASLEQRALADGDPRPTTVGESLAQCRIALSCTDGVVNTAVGASQTSAPMAGATPSRSTSVAITGP
jgi:hypothetical protein